MVQPFSRPIFWPLVLVGAGILWLLANAHVISVDNLLVLVRFWPVLLIAAGLDLLARQRWPWLANLVTLLTVTLAVLAVVFAPRLGFATSSAGWYSWFPLAWGGAPGSGRVVTETREVTGFQAVSFSAVGDLNIKQGNVESLSIEAEDNVLPELQTVVRGGTLYISLANGPLRVWPSRPIRLNLTVKDLNRVELSGAGNTVVSELSTKQLQAILSGAGSLRFDGLAVDQLDCTLSGAGGLTVAGRSAKTSVNVSGVGALHGDDLQTASANVNLSGTGGVTLWVTNDLYANISGLGSLGYYGRPTVTKNVSGLGSVRSLGDK
jgi:putative autotransporter adhesin-like protein/cell wall-active antibiotic response 4TMS protein YvqF